MLYSSATFTHYNPKISLKYNYQMVKEFGTRKVMPKPLAECQADFYLKNTGVG